MTKLHRVDDAIESGSGPTCKRVLQQRFTSIYALNSWKSPESVSGFGSTLASTVHVRAALPKLIARLGCTTVLDAPCGDYHWFRFVVREPHFHYLGADIVEALIDLDRFRYGSADTEFDTLDIVNEVPPRADLWLCRDCLSHLSFGDAWNVLRNFARSRAAFFLTTTHVAQLPNREIVSGDFRTLNLHLEPFLLPPGIDYLDDPAFESPERRMGLWSREQIVSRLRYLGTEEHTILDATS
jgi:hypothetical protein